MFAIWSIHRGLTSKRHGKKLSVLVPGQKGQVADVLTTPPPFWIIHKLVESVTWIETFSLSLSSFVPIWWRAHNSTCGWTYTAATQRIALYPYACLRVLQSLKQKAMRYRLYGHCLIVVPVWHNERRRRNDDFIGARRFKDWKKGR